MVYASSSGKRQIQIRRPGFGAWRLSQTLVPIITGIG
jgi:hypothetical protein